METEVVNQVSQLVKQVGDSGGVLVLLIPPLVQILKRIPFIVNLQASKFPAYELLTIALGIGGAYAMGLANPLIMGIVAALAAGKGYDWAKGSEPAKAPNVP